MHGAPLEVGPLGARVGCIRRALGLEFRAVEFGFDQGAEIKLLGLRVELRCLVASGPKPRQTKQALESPASKP